MMTTNKDSEYPLPPVKPEEVGFSSERLARIHPTLQKYIDEEKVPNLVTLIARDGKVVHFDAQGYMDLASKKPASKDTIFRLYSNSKPIAGVVTMMLCEEGKLNLDDSVSKYIPAFKNQVVHVPYGTDGVVTKPPSIVPVVPVRRDITIRDCLRNTTGLATPQSTPIYFMAEFDEEMKQLGWYPGATPPKISFRERAEIQARLPLSFQPGKDFVYHVGYPVLTAVLETIVGMSLEEFYQERIFKPLGMKDSSFYMTDDRFDRFPPCYRPKLNDGEWELEILERAETSEKVKGPKTYFGVGGTMGGILSTAADYARFAQMLLNGGELDGTRIISRKSVALMTSNHTGDIKIDMTGYGFGFGMGVSVHKGGSHQPIMRSVGSYGWGGAAGTIYFADPKEKLIVICFTQVTAHLMMPGNNYQEDFERLVYQALL